MRAVRFLVNADGRLCGEAVVAFHSAEDAKRALSLHSREIAGRYQERALLDMIACLTSLRSPCLQCSR